MIDKISGVIKNRFRHRKINEKIDLNKEYIEKIKKIPQKNVKVEVAYKLLDDAIKTKFKRNIVKQKSFQERIERSLSKYHSKFEDYETVMKRLEDVAKEVTLERKREEKLNLSDEEIAFYDIVSKGKNYVNSEKEIRKIAINLTTYLKNKVTIDWINQEQVKAEIRVSVRNILRKANIPFEEIDKLIPIIMEQAENNYGQVSLLLRSESYFSYSSYIKIITYVEYRPYLGYR